jgi:hypothetical protein
MPALNLLGSSAAIILSVIIKYKSSRRILYSGLIIFLASADKHNCSPFMGLTVSAEEIIRDRKILREIIPPELEQLPDV